MLLKKILTLVGAILKKVLIYNNEHFGYFQNL